MKKNWKEPSLIKFGLVKWNIIINNGENTCSVPQVLENLQHPAHFRFTDHFIDCFYPSINFWIFKTTISLWFIYFLMQKLDSTTWAEAISLGFKIMLVWCFPNNFLRNVQFYQSKQGRFLIHPSLLLRRTRFIRNNTPFRNFLVQKYVLNFALKEVVNLAAPYFVFENSRHFQRATFIFWKFLPPYFFVQK